MCTIKRLKKLVQVLDAAKEKSPEMLYPGDFVRCTVDGEVYVVAVLWDTEHSVYIWLLASLEGTDTMRYYPKECVISTSRNAVLRSEFWEDNDPDWEVINLGEEECD